MSESERYKELGPRESENPEAHIDPLEEPVEDHEPSLYSDRPVEKFVVGIENVGENEIQFFRDEGYLLVRGVFTEKEVEDAKDGIRDLIHGSRPDYRGVQIEALARGREITGEERERAVRKIGSFVEYDERLMALAVHAGMRSVVERIMGEKSDLFQDMALLKPPGGREKPWHQDCAYFDVPLGTDIIGVWIALDPATAENGCLHVIPGTHREGPVDHFKRRDWQICDTDVQIAREVMVPLDPGDCLIWHGMTHHGSPTNRTDQRRRALQFHYNPRSVEKTSKEERLGIWGGEMKGAEC